MQIVNVNELVPHPRNDYFFDDINGENWDAFLESIKTSGVIEPIIVDAKTKLIVSGNQRIKACKELKIEQVLCDYKNYETEDQMLKDLIETNIRQRGIGNPNPIKLGRCIKELERIYGIRNGSYNSKGVNQYISEPNNSDDKLSQSELASIIGISVDTLNNYKKLTDLIPDLTDLVDTGIVKPTTALSIVKTMSPEEQEKFITDMDITKKITQKQVQSYIDQMQQLKNENAEYELKLKKVDALSSEINRLKLELENRPEIEKEPDDYKSTKKKLSDYQTDYSRLQSEYSKKVNELQQLKRTIDDIKSVTPEEQYSKKLKDSAIFFCARVNEFIEKTGGFVWLTEHINELPDYERKSYLSAVNAVSSWSETLKNNINE